MLLTPNNRNIIFKYMEYYYDEYKKNILLNKLHNYDKKYPFKINMNLVNINNSLERIEFWTNFIEEYIEICKKMV